MSMSRLNSGICGPVTVHGVAGRAGAEVAVGYRGNRSNPVVSWGDWCEEIRVWSGSVIAAQIREGAEAETAAVGRGNRPRRLAG